MLTKKAILNFIAAIIDQVTRIAILLILAPLIISTLGEALFGYWQMLLKASNQIAPLDGRPSELLKWKVAQMQSDCESERRNMALGAAVTIWLVFIPLVLLIGLIVFFLLPTWVGIDQQYLSEGRIAGFILLINLFLLGIIALLEAVFRGMNIGYKRMGMMAASLIFGGALSYTALKHGGGLIELAWATTFASLIYLVCFFVVVKSHLPWLKITWPNSKEAISFGEKSVWFSAWAFINAGLFLGDMLILGLLSSSELVANYTVSAFAVQSIVVVVVTAVMAVLPGIGRLLEREGHKKANEVWREGKHYMLWLTGTVSCCVLLLNESFVGVWVDSKQFVGDIENVLIVICGVQLVFLRQDAAVINLALDLRQKVYWGGAAMLVCLGLAVILVPRYEIVGLCLSLLIGRSVLSIKFPKIIAVLLKSNNAKLGAGNFKMLSMFLLLLLAWQISKLIEINSWADLILLGVGSALIFCVLNFYLVLPKKYQAKIVGRLRSFS